MPIRIGNQWFEATPGQAAQLAAVQARCNTAIARVRELDPSWRPTRSLHQQNVEGFIRAYRGEALEAEARLAELTRAGIGPGPFAGESIPARGPGRDFYASERRDMNRIFNQTGCHTCGTRDPGTPTGTPSLITSRLQLGIHTIDRSDYFLSAGLVAVARAIG